MEFSALYMALKYRSCDRPNNNCNYFIESRISILTKMCPVIGKELGPGAPVFYAFLRFSI